MLEYIFGSKTRLKLLGLFLKNPGGNFFVRELSRKTGSQLNAVRRELDNLLKIGLVAERDVIAPFGAKKASGEGDPPHPARDTWRSWRRVASLSLTTAGCNAPPTRCGGKRKYYCLNPAGRLNQELLTLLVKDQLLAQENFINPLKESVRVDYLVLGGHFVGEGGAPTDILIVGSLSSKDAKQLVRMFEKESGNEIRYTVMSKREFLYRRDVADKFLTALLQGRHIVALDKIHKA